MLPHRPSIFRTCDGFGRLRLRSLCKIHSKGGHNESEYGYGLYDN